MSQDTDQSTVGAEADQPGDSPVVDGLHARSAATRSPAIGLDGPGSRSTATDTPTATAGTPRPHSPTSSPIRSSAL